MSEIWQIESAEEEDAWTLDYLREILDAPCAICSSLKFGSATAHWKEIDPNVAIVHSEGGTLEDRYLAEQLLVSKLKERGIERAEFSFDPEHKTSDWNDIMDKAQRLIQSGNVTLLRNGYNNIVAHVIGDHGEYNTEIGRDDPNSRAITTWQCDCPWDQFAWGRTRKWKKYEGRPCSHVLAAFWAAQSAPLDSDASGENIPPGQKPPMPGGGEQMQIPFQEQGPVSPPPQPASPGVLPPFPGEQMQLLPPGQLQPGQPGISVSMPGARQPTPFNPVQNPSTYSKVGFEWPSNATNMLGLESAPEDEEGWYKWKVDHSGLGISPAFIDGKKQYHMNLGITDRTYSHPDGYLSGVIAPNGLVTGYAGKVTPDLVAALQRHVDQPLRIPTEEETDEAVRNVWKLAADFENADMVRLEEAEYGILEGKSEEHGAGQYKEIPKGSIGEVLGQDPTTGWVDVIFVGPQKDAGPLEPYHIRAWIDKSKLTPMPGIQPPGPAVRRRQ